MNIGSVQFSSVAQSCPTLCDSMDCSMPGFPVQHQLLEVAQTHVHWVGDAIQPSHPLSSPSPSVFNLSQHQGLFQWVGLSHQVTIVLVAIIMTFTECLLGIGYYVLCMHNVIYSYSDPMRKHDYNFHLQIKLRLVLSVCVCLADQSCSALCGLMYCSLPASSVLGIFQARALEWVAVLYSRGFSWPRDQMHVSCKGSNNRSDSLPGLPDTKVHELNLGNILSLPGERPFSDGFQTQCIRPNSC